MTRSDTVEQEIADRRYWGFYDWLTKNYDAIRARIQIGDTFPIMLSSEYLAITNDKDIPSAIGGAREWSRVVKEKFLEANKQP